MKVMFVCAGGMSTAMTAKKLMEIASKNDVEMDVVARGTSDFQEELEDNKYDVVLVAPQIRHRYKEVAEVVGKYEGVVVDKIAPVMYAPMERSVKQLFDFIMGLTK
jgi:PTS system cellobiose-specific IIB component